MTAHLNLTAGTIGPLLTELDALLREAEARRVSLLHESGLVLAETGEDAHLDRGESGALAAGAFFAARHLAGRLGEPSFSGLHYRGAHRDFLLDAAGPEALLLVVFDSRTSPAIVRACVRKYQPAIESAAGRLHAPPPGGPPAPSIIDDVWACDSLPFRESAAPADSGPLWRS
jgi:predicted regulator of Ras-like GTPase activity (Roadblock/LC7/MglB family)